MSDTQSKQRGGGADRFDDYVDVAERIRQFYDTYPQGRLQREGEPEVMAVGDKLFVVYRALASRYPGDPEPGQGIAWEPFPGPTAFTRDSELMNAETAAWGRAIVCVGIPTRRIASQEELRARTGNSAPEGNGSTRAAPAHVERPAGRAPQRTGRPATVPQRKLIKARADEAGLDQAALEAVLNQTAGTSHIDRVEMSKVDAVLDAISHPAEPAATEAGNGSKS